MCQNGLRFFGIGGLSLYNVHKINTFEICSIYKFIASTNSNDTVPKFLKSGIYKPKPSVTTISNAMDVGNPSNMQRIMNLYGNSNELKKDIMSWNFSDKDTN